MSIDLKGVSRTIGQHKIIKDVSLAIEEGELLALLGPSGSGKTTLLRIIAGLESLDSGQVLLSGADATSQKPGDRGIGFVFQHYALFRHMTVFENVAFGLRVKPRKERPSEKEIQERVKELLSLVQLDWIAQRKPSELSGGQRQRVALARALAVKPRVLLLDEPFGALDARVRRELRRWLRKLHDDVKVTTVFVTHDQEEALEVADRVVVMNNGRIEQIGSPEEVYTKPATPFVLSFLGSVNLFHSRIAGGQAHVAGVTVEAPEHAQAEDSAGLVFVRNHDIVVHRAQPESQVVPGTVEGIRAVGPTARLIVSVQGSSEPVEVDLSAERLAQLALKIGDTVFLELRNARIYRQEEDASPSGGAKKAAGGAETRVA